MSAVNKPQKDVWDKLDIISKGLIGIFVSLAIGFYGVYTGDKQFQVAEENRKAQIMVQTMSNREAASADLKAKMFSTLLAHYLKKQDDPVTQRIILELIGLNFQEHLRLRPLFEKLEKELAENSKELYNLRKSARNMARIEIDNIVGNNGRACEFDLVYGKPIAIGELCELPISLHLLDVDEEGIRVSANDDDKHGFSVNYYDMPLVDNTVLGDYIYSIVLIDKKTQPVKTAKVKVVIMPEHFFSAVQGLQTDQIIGDWMEEDLDESTSWFGWFN